MIVGAYYLLRGALSEILKKEERIMCQLIPWPLCRLIAARTHDGLVPLSEKFCIVLPPSRIIDLEI